MAKSVQEKPDNHYLPFLLEGKEEWLYGMYQTLILLGYEVRYQDGKEFGVYGAKEDVELLTNNI